MSPLIYVRMLGKVKANLVVAMNVFCDYLRAAVILAAKGTVNNKLHMNI